MSLLLLLAWPTDLHSIVNGVSVVEESDGSGELAAERGVHRRTIRTDDIHTRVPFSFTTLSEKRNTGLCNLSGSV